MFKIGETVVCVNNKPIYKNNPYNDSLTKLEEKETYTIEKVDFDSVVLKEVKSSHPSGGYNGKRFRKLDHTFAEEVTARIEEEINQENLIEA